MSTKRKSTESVWYTIAKILLFVFALYLAYIVLRPLISLVLGIGFWFIKIVVFCAVAILVVHLFLKIIFGIDLIAGYTKRK